MLEDPRAQLQQAYTLIKAGQKPQAFAMLNSLVHQQPASFEGWWLIANAAPSPDIARQACQRALALRPDYAPAKLLLADQQLLEALSLLEQGQKPEARELIQSVLDQQPTNLRAWWAMANAAPSRVDSVQALQRLLAIQPDHPAARQMLMELQQQSAKELAQKHHAKDTKPKVRKSRVWVIFALIGLIGLVLSGGYFTMSVTGTTFGLPVGQFFSARYSLGTLGDKPVAKAGTIISGAIHDYQFYGRANTHVLMLLSFPVSKTDPSKAVKIFGPNTQQLAVDQSSTLSMPGAFDLTLPTSGNYLIQITGMSNVAQGPYELELVAVDDMQDFNNFNPMQQP